MSFVIVICAIVFVACVAIGVACIRGAAPVKTEDEFAKYMKEMYSSEEKAKRRQ